MLREINDTNIHPYSTVTDCPSVSDIAMVVLKPKGTAMMANDKPNMLIILRDLGSSLL